MAQSLQVKISGLYSYPSDLSEVPPGALTQAQNIILDRDSIAEPRRGYDYLAYTSASIAYQAQFPLATQRASKYFFFQNQALAQYSADKLAWFDSTAGWTAFSGDYTPVSNTATGTLALGSAVVTSLSAISGVANGGTGLVVGQLVYGTGVPVGTFVVSFTSNTVTLSQVATANGSGVTLTFIVAKSRNVQAAQNLFLTTNLGVRKLTGYSTTPTLAGVPQALDLQTYPAAATAVTASINWATSDTVLHVTSTAGLGIGMTSDGTGNIPSTSFITALTATTITISVAASGAGSSANFTATATPIAASNTVYTFDSVNYRVVWNILDANNNLITGAPSQVWLAQNLTGVACAFNVEITIPSTITTSHYYQVYRSFPATTGASAVSPNDNEYLVYEGFPTAGDISRGFLTVCDLAPTSLFGAEIYTAIDQEGAAMANLPLPQAQDIAVFRDCMFYANTQSLQNTTVTLLGVGGATGLQAADTITIGGVTYTAATTETASSGQFLLVSAYSGTSSGTTSSSSITVSSVTTTGLKVGMTVTASAGIPQNTFITSVGGSSITISNPATASGSRTLTFTGQTNGDPTGGQAQSIQDTAQSLVRVINRYSSSTVTAVYISGTGTAPGQVLLTAKTFSNTGFTVSASRSTCWTPLTVGAGTCLSSASIAKNGLWFSKQNQPESVPLPYFLQVGTASANILRVIALRDSLIILKEDGTFILQGDSPQNFLLRPLDYTSILLAPESATLLNNQIFCLTTQGVVSVSEVGTPVVSHPIEGALLQLMSGDNLPALKAATFGIAYESDRAYYLFLPSTSADTSATQYYRWNYLTSRWVSGLLSKTCGHVNPATNLLWLGDATLNITSIERKSYTYSDYADYKSTQTFVTADGQTLTSVTEIDTFAVGDVVWQAPTVWGIVASIDAGANTLVLTLITSLVSGAADILSGISTAMTWAPVTLDNPGFTKQIWEGTLLFLAGFQGPGVIGFTTDITQAEGTEDLTGGSVGPWGLFAWGGPQDIVSGNTLDSLGAYWGGDPQRGTVRFSVGRNWQRCSQMSPSFTHSYAYSPWKMQGLSLIGNLTSERTRN